MESLLQFGDQFGSGEFAADLCGLGDNQVHFVVQRLFERRAA